MGRRRRSTNIFAIDPKDLREFIEVGELLLKEYAKAEGGKRFD